MGNRMTGPGSYQWQSLPTTSLRMPVQVTRLLNSIMATILMFFLKTSMMHALDLPQPKNWLWNWGNWWMFTAKTFCTPRTSKSKLITRVWSLGLMHRMRKCGSIANTLRWKDIENSKPNFLGLFKCFTQLGSKHTSWNF